MRRPRVRVRVEWVDVRFRFTLRGLMVLVALTAIVMPLVLAGVARWRSHYLTKDYRQRAVEFGAMETVFLTSSQISIDNKKRYAGRPEDIKSLDDQAQKSSRIAEHYGMLKRKYLDAADSPLAPMESDPPAPE